MNLSTIVQKRILDSQEELEKYSDTLNWLNKYMAGTWYLMELEINSIDNGNTVRKLKGYSQVIKGKHLLFISMIEYTDNITMYSAAMMDDLVKYPHKYCTNHINPTVQSAIRSAILDNILPIQQSINQLLDFLNLTTDSAMQSLYLKIAKIQDSFGEINKTLWS